MIGQPSESAVRPAQGRSSGNSKKKNKRGGPTGTARRRLRKTLAKQRKQASRLG